MNIDAWVMIALVVLGCGLTHFKMKVPAAVVWAFTFGYCLVFLIHGSVLS